ncbi:aminotransferase class IV family protein [Tabrizicola sp. BL-A-41-H6]|uniref:aminotransferase class IV family protein n=1 Tax=Tabrizicola sp. BL-A-41-H6 TaxID=3421107 RepID=UPI003D673051
MESALREGGRTGVRLIETLLWDGTRFPRLALHMARLARGAEALGWDAPHLDLGATSPDDPARVRLTLGAGGDVSVEVAALPPAKPLWRVGLAEARLSSTDPWLTIKSTRREVYDRARANLSDDLDEVIFLNERCEVCDGTITTVFFDRGAGLRTPPLTSGLLPGVLRAELACPEEVLLAADLPHVRLWVGNALRGLSPATFICPQISPPEASTPAT